MTQIQRVGSGGQWEQLYGYARAVSFGGWTITSGCTASLNGTVQCKGDPFGQTKVAFQVALDALVDAGAGISDVVRTRMYVTNPEHADAVGRAHGELFGVIKPVATLIVVARLLDPDHLVEVELDAFRGEKPKL